MGIRRVSVSFIFVMHILVSGISNGHECFLPDKSFATLGYSTGEFICIDTDYIEMNAFLPAGNDKTLIFADVWGYRFLNDRKWAGSAGIGIRRNSDFGILGLNAYYDYRDIASKVNFNRIGVGAELLTGCFDFRVNSYLPVGGAKKTSELCIFDKLGDGFFATKKRREFSYGGFDAEIGRLFLKKCGFTFYGAVGPYYYHHSDLHNFWGGMCRLELNWKSLISLQVRVSYDKVYSTKVQGIIEISIPFSFFCRSKSENCCSCNCFIAQPVRRNNIILTDRCCDWTWNWDDKN